MRRRTKPLLVQVTTTGEVLSCSNVEERSVRPREHLCLREHDPCAEVDLSQFKALAVIVDLRRSRKELEYRMDVHIDSVVERA